jgi:hypothetical protein
VTRYYELSGTESVDPSDLQLERAGQLFQAAMHDEDCAFIECRRSEDNGREVVVVDLKAHGIPTRCRIGIEFPERIAFVVPRDPRRLVIALMLRKEFPVLIHQNQTPADTPRDLCLHYEPKEAVLRTWTAQRFIRRVKWWLASSATGTLHAADQLPETLFFNSDNELVVPPSFNELVAAGRKFGVALSETHVGGGNTYLLFEAPEQYIGSPEPIQIVLPPVVHGYIEDTPQTMEALAQMFASRNVDLLGLMREQVASRLSPQGAKQPFGGVYTIIVLHTPMRRLVDEAPSRTLHHAFIIFEPFLEVGRKIGALLLHEGTYFRENALFGQAAEVQNLGTMLLAQFALLRRNDTKDFRSQSGSDDEGMKSVLVGAGALGSSMLNLWARSGWGTWTVIDKDHIKPHNLTRHVAVDAQIGHGKALVVSGAAIAATKDSSRFRALQADAMSLGNAEVAAELGAASLVIDASTTLEYPRLASDTVNLPRHISVFLTPSGRSSVLLAENADRSINLRTIESQYYRALINESWGQYHLVGNLGTFWSGASCRDISFRLSLAQVQLHAANLAQMVTQSAMSCDARIAVWHRDTDTGAVQAYAVPAFKATTREIGDFTVNLDEGLEDELRAMRAALLPNETGGILLGYHDLSLKRIVIVKACPAPTDSVGTPTSFVRGIQGVAELLKDAGTRTANIVGYLGEWHSHPRGHSANASRDDVVQLVGLALSMVEDGLPALQLIVGETDINVSLAQSS